MTKNWMVFPAGPNAEPGQDARGTQDSRPVTRASRALIGQVYEIDRTRQCPPAMRNAANSQLRLLRRTAAAQGAFDTGSSSRFA